jgi:colicin import membrane protein
MSIESVADESVVSTDLVAIEQTNLVAVFEGDAMDPLIERIEREVMSHVPDISTQRGRQAIASLAYKIARSKTALDSAGKGLVSDIKARAGVIDASRKKMRDRLDELRDRVRLPLTEWEQAEEDRVNAHRDAIAMIRDMPRTHSDNGTLVEASTLAEIVRSLDAIVIDERWEEFANEASIVRDESLRTAKRALENQIKHEAEQAELAKLRREQQERIEKEREDRIRREAAERAKQEAEREAREAREAMERQARKDREESERKLRDERLAAERREQELVLQAERAKREQIEAIHNAKMEAERKAEVERKAKEREAEERRLREADQKHRSRLMSEAKQALMSEGMTETNAKTAIKAIVAGRVPHITIKW